MIPPFNLSDTTIIACNLWDSGQVNFNFVDQEPLVMHGIHLSFRSPNITTEFVGLSGFGIKSDFLNLNLGVIGYGFFVFRLSKDENFTASYVGEKLKLDRHSAEFITAMLNSVCCLLIEIMTKEILSNENSKT